MAMNSPGNGLADRQAWFARSMGNRRRLSMKEELALPKDCIVLEELPGFRSGKLVSAQA
jgi:hypothetical protein